MIRALATLLVCIASTDPNATCNPGMLILTWTRGVGPQEDAFAIDRRDPGDVYGKVGFIAPRGATSYIDFNTELAKSYCYRVSAYNRSGQSDWSNEACGVASSPDVLPNGDTVNAVVQIALRTIITLPQDLTAVKTSPNSVRLTWSKITDPAAAWVIVQVSKDGGPFALINDSKTSTAGTSYDHIGVTPGTYKYRLRVWDSTLTKPLGFSNESNAVVV